MIDLLEQMNFWHWIALGLVLLLLELLGTAGYLLWLGISAVLVGVLLIMLPVSWPLQWVCFAVFALFTTWLWWRYQHKKDKTDDSVSKLNQRGAQMIGQTILPTAGSKFTAIAASFFCMKLLSFEDKPHNKRVKTLLA